MKPFINILSIYNFEKGKMNQIKLFLLYPQPTATIMRPLVVCYSKRRSREKENSLERPLILFARRDTAFPLKC